MRHYSNLPIPPYHTPMIYSNRGFTISNRLDLCKCHCYFIKRHYQHTSLLVPEIQAPLTKAIQLSQAHQGWPWSLGGYSFLHYLAGAQHASQAYTATLCSGAALNDTEPNAYFGEWTSGTPTLIVDYNTSSYTTNSKMIPPFVMGSNNSSLTSHLWPTSL